MKRYNKRAPVPALENKAMSITMSVQEVEPTYETIGRSILLFEEEKLEKNEEQLYFLTVVPTDEKYLDHSASEYLTEMNQHDESVSFAMPLSQFQQLLQHSHPFALRIRERGFICERTVAPENNPATSEAGDLAKDFLALAIVDRLYSHHRHLAVNLKHAAVYACVHIIERMTGYRPCTRDMGRLLQYAGRLQPEIATSFRRLANTTDNFAHHLFQRVEWLVTFSMQFDK